MIINILDDVTKGRRVDIDFYYTGMDYDDSTFSNVRCTL